MDFRWDEAKARANHAKHGVSFEEAAEVFADPLALVVEDVAHPERLIIIGSSMSARVLLVVFIERDEDRIRIVSARLATSHERRHYEEGT
ncbi:MAG: hypothetical protein A2138_27170 [Deltaproteobacteria bacterium RBG_16_71_12]|nr:MAG: hypothetical protein A2138_27170 [Deltaproteobacteria bacterium RBG_16_71_12]